MLVKEYIRCDVHDLVSLIKSRQVSAEEALDCALARVDEVNPAVNAIVMDCSQFARRCLANMRGDEPYYGVPLLVKDLGHAIEGVISTEGSRFFSSNIAPQSSDLVTKLISLGFVPFAKTNIPELGLSYVTESALFGPCRNPYDLNRTAGGSSGGSAAAVATGIAPVATASDGGGSIRIPAACCGLFGFKPTTGLTPTGPLVDELWSGMATNFVISRSVRDTAALFEQLTNQNRAHVLPHHKKSLTITYLEGAFAPVAVDQQYLQAIEKVTELLKKAGHHLNKKHLNLDLNALGECTITLIAANTCEMINLQQQRLGRKAKREELEPITWEFYQRGQALLAHEFIAAKNRLYQLVRPLHELLNHSDVVLTPALAQLPIAIGQLRTDDEFSSYLQKNTEFSPFTSLFNQAGLPAMSLPVLFHHQLPLSVQLGAGKGKDLLLLSLARELSAMAPDIIPVPPI
ncbi:amidase [Legionella maioricensis]|uniref:Amidase n=1 Tax=Legionella maioricensis TaxID=2896528 RepID=A0A9X2CXZ9_9GAMM|nr:amidase [Legionella maioricensis]MCL9682945.1 amidase [Legionella maioricensis]MCL9686293.1 amidase [Legionella maioricensis]